MRSPTESIEDNRKKLLTVKDDGILLHKIKPCKTLVPNRTMICLDANIFFGKHEKCLMTKCAEICVSYNKRSMSHLKEVTFLSIRDLT